MRYPIILMDADDTIFDFQKACHRALDQVFGRYGIPNTPENHQLYLSVNHTVWDELERGLITKDEMRTERFARLFKALGISGDLEGISDDYVYELGQGAFLIDGALDVCRALSKDHRIYIVTNGIEQVQRSRMSRSPVREYISGVFVSEAVGIAKPGKGYFDYVFSQIPDFSREKSVIVGDSLTSDIAGGVNAGIATCWYNPAGKPNPSGLMPDYEIRELSRLLDIL